MIILLTIIALNLIIGIPTWILSSVYGRHEEDIKVGDLPFMLGMSFVCGTLFPFMIIVIETGEWVDRKSKEWIIRLNITKDTVIFKARNKKVDETKK